MCNSSGLGTLMSLLDGRTCMCPSGSVVVCTGIHCTALVHVGLDDVSLSALQFLDVYP